MAFAARVSDLTDHPGVITGPGVPTVLICGMPAAVVGDMHTCAFPPPAVHPPTPFPLGSLSVHIGARAALRAGDLAGCGARILPPILPPGAAPVMIGG